MKTIDTLNAFDACLRLGLRALRFGSSAGAPTLAKKATDGARMRSVDDAIDHDGGRDSTGRSAA